MEYIIETKDLVKKYGPKAAVDKMSVHVKKGDIYGLIGKNGAGKTTLMKLILGLTNANSGEIKLFGSTALNRSRKRIGSLIEAPAIYKNETAYENMKRFAILTGAKDDEIKSLLELVGLGKTGKKKAGHFSLGMRQRLGLAMALLGNPEVLVLDEPINGLDPAGIKEIRDIILELNKKGVTFIISSHLLDELGKIATNYGIVNNGILVEEITATDLREKCKTSLEIITNDNEAAKDLLLSKDPAIELVVEDEAVVVTSHVEDTSAINETLVKGGIKVYQLKTRNVGFEDFFIERLGK